MIEIKMTCENNLVDQEKKLFLFLESERFVLLFQD